MDRDLVVAGRKVIKDRGDRASRTRPRVPVSENCYNSSNLWQNGVWINSFPDEPNNLGNQDFSPGFALRKIALLFENRKWEECADLIDRLSMITLRTIVPELPVDVIIDSVPSSLPILEALYVRLYIPGDPEAFPSNCLHPEQLIGKVVRWLVVLHGSTKQTNSHDYYVPMVQRILKIISKVNPRIKRKLKQKQFSLTKCVDGLASHGLVDTSDTKLKNLHEALKSEINRMIHHLRAAVQKLDDLSLTQRMSALSSRVTQAPSGVSHQRLMQLTQFDIQERLIKNKSLFNVVEPALTNKYLQSLISTLDKRIEADKEVLFHFTELRKEVGDLPQNTVISSTFQNYCSAYSRVSKIFE